MRIRQLKKIGMKHQAAKVQVSRHQGFRFIEKAEWRRPQTRRIDLLFSLILIGNVARAGPGIDLSRGRAAEATATTTTWAQLRLL